MLVGSSITSLGIPNTIIKNFPFLSKKTRKPEGLFLVFVIPVLASFLILATLYILSKDLVTNVYSEAPLLTEYFLYALPMILFTSLFGVLNGFITAYLNTVFASFLQEILLRIVVVVDLILIYFGIIGFELFLIIFAANYALQFLILVGYGLAKNFLSLRPSFDAISRPVVSKVTSYSLFSFFGGLTMILVGNIDVLMLSAFEGLAQTGIYSIAFYVGSVISIPRKSISKITFPVISKAFEEDNMPEISSVYKQSSLNQFLGGFLIYIGVWANIDNLYAMLPPEYAAGGIVILIIGMANLFDMISGVNGQIIMSSDFYRYNLIFTSFLVVLSIIMNLVFIPVYGIIGAAIATGFSLFIYNVIKLIFVWLKFRIQPFTSKTIGMILNGTIVLLLSFLLPNLGNIYLDILIRSGLMLILYTALIWIFNLSTEFKQVLVTIYKRVF